MVVQPRVKSFQKSIIIKNNFSHWNLIMEVKKLKSTENAFFANVLSSLKITKLCIKKLMLNCKQTTVNYDWFI